MYKVKGKEGLYKDPSTNAVINKDRRSFEAAKKAKNQIMNSRKRELDLEERVSILEQALKNLMNGEQNEANE